MKKLKRKKGEYMKKNHLINNLNPRVKSLILIISLLILGIIIGIIISTLSSPYVLEQIESRPSKIPEFELTEEIKSQIVSSYTIITTILCINITLLFGLLYIYKRTYHRTKSRYLVGFSIFIGVLLAKSIAFLAASTPLLSEYARAAPGYIGVMRGSTFGPFAIYFTIFEIIAMCILLFLSNE
jgi:cytochrome bd-type quinol oxidase subunit 2